MRTHLRPWHVVLFLNVLYLLAVWQGGDINVFVRLGDCYSQCRDVECDINDGYDGQFAYYIAQDPAGAEPCLDVPAYRYQRILLPVLGRLLTVGHTDWVPLAFVAINLTALVASTAILENLLLAEGVSRWYALSYGLFYGVVVATRLSTPEPLAYGLALAAIWFAQQKRDWPMIVMLVAAAFAKETSGLVATGMLLYLLLQRQWRKSLTLGLAVGIPFFLWQFYLYQRFGSFGIGSGGAGATGFEIIPYRGLWQIAEASPLAFLILGLVIVPAVVLPGLWGLWHTGRDLTQSKHHLYTCLLFTNAAILPFVPFSTYREPLAILRFSIGLVMLHVLYGARRHPGRPLSYSTFWIALLAFLITG